MLLIFAIAYPGYPAGAVPEVSLEYQVKAAFIDKFFKFIDWPDSAFPSPDSPIKIAVLGDGPMTDALKAIENDQPKGRRLVIRHIKNPQEAGNSHVLFINPSEKSRVNEILRSLKGLNVLTISEIDGFCGKGGVINFILAEGKVRFEINTAAATEASLEISSKLLRLATIVRTQSFPESN